jgi:hypothetical protein
MNISHRPLFDTEKVSALYSKKDGVPVRYVCTSAPNQHAAYAADIFYRSTTHPEFGNRYFGLYSNQYKDGAEIVITNADKIEELVFDMIEVNGNFHYSQHRHDFYNIGDVSIDGGRSYLRVIGNYSKKIKRFKVVNGNFVEVEHEL